MKSDVAPSCRHVTFALSEVLFLCGGERVPAPHEQSVPGREAALHSSGSHASTIEGLALFANDQMQGLVAAGIVWLWRKKNNVKIKTGLKIL